MRAVVMILALLAGLKIWAHDQMFRSGAEEALIAAYRERAIAACQRDAARTSQGAVGRIGAGVVVTRGGKSVDRQVGCRRQHLGRR